MEGWYKAKEPKPCQIFSTNLKACCLPPRVSPARVTFDGNSLDRYKTLLWLRFATCGSGNICRACHTGTPWPGNQLFIHRSRLRNKNKPVHSPSACLLTNLKLLSPKMEMPLKEVQCAHPLVNIHKSRV